ncbi:MAG: hypothetical protein HYW16_06450 [Candidatus Rokubacteria bacterium]|nr:hypothetical protein [Candidatus Rokubacteria bacterium]MBI2544842.1 hypothetical protein [Candidatus Rokubacteria bacterium]
MTSSEWQGAGQADAKNLAHFVRGSKFPTYGAERLDPGQDATQSVDVDFPAEALKVKKLKEIRLELTYIPSPYKEETVNFTVSISGQ